jgi:hypothetical protein
MIIAVIILSLGYLGYDGSASAQQRLTGRENHAITQREAKALLKNHRDASPAGTLLGEFFGGETIRAILDQPNCVGLRIYLGRKQDGNQALVLTGVDQNGFDLMSGRIAEMGYPCPPMCDTSHKPDW